MRLKDCQKGILLCVTSIDLLDTKVKLRLCEIGLFESTNIKVLNKSFLNKTILIQVLDSCFAIKGDIAENIQVEYV